MKFFDDYLLFLKKNYTNKVNPIEEQLKQLSYILPVRALVNSLQFLNKRLVSLQFPLYTCINGSLKISEALGETFERSSKLYRLAAYLLVIIRKFQASLEMLASRIVGNDKKFNVILIIELVKALLKVAIFISTKGKPLLDTVLNESIPPVLKNNEEFEVGKLSGKLLSIPKKIEFNYREAKMANGEGSWEILRIIQPALYAFLITKYGPFKNGSKSWIPWITSLCVGLLIYSQSNKIALPKEETDKRKIDLILFIFKEPFYGNFIKPYFDSILGSRNFILKPLLSLLKEYQLLLEENYFYTTR